MFFAQNILIKIFLFCLLWNPFVHEQQLSDSVFVFVCDKLIDASFFLICSGD